MLILLCYPKQWPSSQQSCAGDSQRLENDSCHLDTLSLSDIFLNVSDFCDGLGEESRKSQYRLRWCHLRAIVVSGICRMRKSTNAVTSSRFEKKQRVVYWQAHVVATCNCKIRWFYYVKIAISCSFVFEHVKKFLSVYLWLWEYKESHILSHLEMA